MGFIVVIADIIFGLTMLAIVLAYLAYVRKQNNQAMTSDVQPFTAFNHRQQAKPDDALFSAETNKAQSNMNDGTSNKNAAPPYRCVVIKTGTQTCEHVRALGNRPILLTEAPLLPLTGCNVRKCQCKFTRHDDRRMTDRRTFFGAAKEIIENHSNKREREDRRKNPHTY